MGSFRCVLGYGRSKSQSLVRLFQAQADFTWYKNSSLKFWSEFDIKGTFFLSSKTFSAVIMMFY